MICEGWAWQCTPSVHSQRRLPLPQRVAVAELAIQFRELRSVATNNLPDQAARRRGAVESSRVHCRREVDKAVPRLAGDGDGVGELPRPPLARGFWVAGSVVHPARHLRAGLRVVGRQLGPVRAWQKTGAAAIRRQVLDQPGIPQEIAVTEQAEPREPGGAGRGGSGVAGTHACQRRSQSTPGGRTWPLVE